jgi:hypothetical protein
MHNSFLRILLLSLLLVINSVHASFIQGSSYQKSDLIRYFEALGDKRFSCLVIHNEDKGSVCRGVLIAPNVVMTVAHGVMEGHTCARAHHLTIKARGPSQSYKVSVQSIWVHPSYAQTMDGEQSAFDVAFLMLKEPLLIPYTPLAEEGNCAKESLFISAQWDVSLQNGYAFAFLEMDRFYRDDDTFAPERRFSFSSLFFNENMMRRPSYDAIEPEARGWDARRRWIEEGRPPFALCLPGSSGSPLFVKQKGRYVVIGLVSAFAPAATETFKTYQGQKEAYYILNQEKKTIVNRYQTVFCFPYLVQQPMLSPLGNSWKFVWDPDIKKFIDKHLTS